MNATETVEETKTTGETEPTPTPEELRLKKIAMKIANNGNPLKFMVGTFNEGHRGDTMHGMSQLVEFGTQSASNTAGEHQTWTGGSGKGKTDGSKAATRQLPPEYVIGSSITSKSLFYRSKDGSKYPILPGSVIRLDDKRVDAYSDLEETLKSIQTNFQDGAMHETVIKGEYLVAHLPPRLMVIRTYVDSHDTESQLQNRSLGYGVDASKETDQEVCNLVLELSEDGNTTENVTRRTLICRELWRDIKSQVYKVVTPASSKIVQFTDVSNRRNPTLFLDMVKGLACIRHRQRLVDDGPNGEKILYANYDDYIEAAKIFNSQGDYIGTRLEKDEFEAVQYIKDQGVKGATVNGIYSHLSDKFPNDGWNSTKVRRLMDGRVDRKNANGLAEKVSGLVIRWEDNQNGSSTKYYSIPGGMATLVGIKVTIQDPCTIETIGSEVLSQLSHRLPALGKRPKTMPTDPIIPTHLPTIPHIGYMGNNTPKIDDISLL